VVVQNWDGTHWGDVATTVYRYYTSDSNEGFTHGLRAVIGPEAYRKMAAASIAPLTATDAQVQKYADFYFKYDFCRRVRFSRTRYAGGVMYGNAFDWKENPNFPILSDLPSSSS